MRRLRALKWPSNEMPRDSCQWISTTQRRSARAERAEAPQAAISEEEWHVIKVLCHVTALGVHQDWSLKTPGKRLEQGKKEKKAKVAGPTARESEWRCVERSS